jgi:hypothetical protein
VPNQSPRMSVLLNQALTDNLEPRDRAWACSRERRSSSFDGAVVVAPDSQLYKKKEKRGTRQPTKRGGGLRAVALVGHSGQNT